MLFICKIKIEEFKINQRINFLICYFVKMRFCPKLSEKVPIAYQFNSYLRKGKLRLKLAQNVSKYPRVSQLYQKLN